MEANQNIEQILKDIAQRYPDFTEIDAKKAKIIDDRLYFLCKMDSNTDLPYKSYDENSLKYNDDGENRNYIEVFVKACLVGNQYKITNIVHYGYDIKYYDDNVVITSYYTGTYILFLSNMSVKYYESPEYKIYDNHIIFFPYGDYGCVCLFFIVDFRTQQVVDLYKFFDNEHRLIGCRYPNCSMNNIYIYGDYLIAKDIDKKYRISDIYNANNSGFIASIQYDLNLSINPIRLLDCYGYALDTSPYYMKIEDGNVFKQPSLIRQLLYNAKEKFDYDSVVQLSQIVAEQIEILYGKNAFDVIVPMPPTEKNRPFQPLYEIAKMVGKIIGVKVDCNYLKSRNTIPIKTIRDKVQRENLLKDAFYIDNPKKYNEKRLLLLEDHCSSGDTLFYAIDYLDKNCKCQRDGYGELASKICDTLVILKEPNLKDYKDGRHERLSEIFPFLPNHDFILSQYYFCDIYRRLVEQFLPFAQFEIVYVKIPSRSDFRIEDDLLYYPIPHLYFCLNKLYDTLEAKKILINQLGKLAELLSGVDDIKSPMNDSNMSNFNSDNIISYLLSPILNNRLVWDWNEVNEKIDTCYNENSAEQFKIYNSTINYINLKGKNNSNINFLLSETWTSDDIVGLNYDNICKIPNSGIDKDLYDEMLNCGFFNNIFISVCKNYTPFVPQYNVRKWIDVRYGNLTIKAYSMFLYYPPTTCTFEIDPFDQQIRNLVWYFKNEPERNIPMEKNSWAIDIIVHNMKKLLTQFFGDHISDLTMVCIPAATQIRTNYRYLEFMERLTKEVPIENGMDHVHILQDATPVHEGGNGEGVYSIDANFFRNKYVLLFDDVITTGRSMLRMCKLLDDNGACVVGGMSIGRTTHTFQKGANQKFDQFYYSEND